MRRAIACNALVLLLVGCGSKAKSTTVKPHAPLLAGTYQLVEIDEDGTEHEIPSGGGREVDVNSRIEVRVDRDAVAKAIGERIGMGGEIVASTQRLATLTALTEEQLAIIRERNALATRVDGLSADQLQASLTPLAERKKALTKQLLAYASSRKMDVQAFFATPGAEGVYALLDAERRSAMDEAAALMTRIAGFGWRMQAILVTGDKSTPIHLHGYDTYESGPFRRIDKLLPSTEHLPAQLDAAAKLSKTTGDLANARDLLVAAALERVREVADTLRSALLDDVRALEGLPQKVAASVKNVAGVKELLAEVDQLGPLGRQLRDRCQPVLDAIDQQLLRNLGLGDAVKCAEGVAEAVPDIVKHVDAAAKAAAKIKAADVKPAVKAQLDAFLDELRVAEALDDKVSEVKTLWQNVFGFVKGVNAEASAPVWRSDLQTDRSVGEVSDTVIDLTRTARNDGDRVEFRVAVVKDGTPLAESAPSVMDVARTGAYIDVSGSVLFVNEYGDDKIGSLEAAPAIVAALHGRARRNGKHPTVRAIWNALQMGIGVHFASPDLGEGVDDPTLEMGVGANVLLFGDLLQAGGGYDLQTNTTYWFVGFGLNSLGKLGVRHPL